MWCIALDQYNALEGMSVANTSEFTSLGQIPWLESDRLRQKKKGYFGKKNAELDNSHFEENCQINQELW